MQITYDLRIAPSGRCEIWKRIEDKTHFFGLGKIEANHVFAGEGFMIPFEMLTLPLKERRSSETLAELS